MDGSSRDIAGTSAALRSELLRLARQEDDLAATQGAAVPYWAPSPPSVHGHRAAAAALREAADRVARDALAPCA